MAISNGTYCIKNADVGSVLDVPHEGEPMTPVHACIHHGRENQQWTVENVEGSEGYHIRSVSSGRYLGILGDSPAPICPLGVSQEPYTWRIKSVPGPDGRARMVHHNAEHGPFASKEVFIMERGSPRDHIIVSVIATGPGNPDPESGREWIFERVN